MPTLLTNSALETLLHGMEGKPAQFVRLETKTKARAIKSSRITSEPFYDVFKTDTVWKVDSRTVLLNAKYENVVNSRRAKEGVSADFKSQGTYGEMDGKCLIRKDDGAVNVRTYYMKNADDKAIWLRADGTELSPELVARLKAEFLPPKKSNPKQGLSEENEFHVMDFKMESIRGLRVAGTEYIMAGV